MVYKLKHSLRDQIKNYVRNNIKRLEYARHFLGLALLRKLVSHVLMKYNYSKLQFTIATPDLPYSLHNDHIPATDIFLLLHLKTQWIDYLTGKE